jgi:hypothetical protein
MSTDWKNIGKNSGNMSQYRNVSHNKLNYKNGKINSIYDISGIKANGYTIDICGENIVLGVGTDKPFSRISLGNNIDSGVFNPSKPGKLSAIALDESASGHGFTGIVLNSQIKTQTNGITSGIQLMSLRRDFSMNDICGGRIILSNDNVTTIGGEAREANQAYEYKGSTSGIGINNNRKVVLDVRGSIRTDGYINFYNTKNGTDIEPAGEDWDNHADVPNGSLFLTAGGGASSASEGVWFKNRSGDLQQVTGTGSESSEDISNNPGFDISINYVVAKGKPGKNGGIPVTFSGNEFDVVDNYPNGFNNAVTIRDGNLAVITPIGDSLNVINPSSNSAPVSYFTDQSGGIILAQKQLLIGGSQNSNNGGRFGYGLIDVQSVKTVPTLQGYNLFGTEPFKPTAATNSIILLTKNTDHNGNSSGGIIGNIHDCSNTIIIGGSNFSNIDTPNSIISINPDLETHSNIRDISGSNIIFGANNDLSGSPFSIIFGTNNKIDNTNKNNYSLEGKENVVFGSDNSVFNSQNSFIQGTQNVNYGNLNVIFGKNNKIGTTSIPDSSYYNYSGSNCFVQGTENTIKAPHDILVNNAFIAGDNNHLDCSYTDVSIASSYIILGSKAKINKDISHVRFAFGTKEMEGNVFTIDMSGNVEISGNLLVKGERTEFRTEYFDVSDNNLSLNYGNTSAPNGGGITLINTGGNKGLIWKNTGGPSSDYWDTSGSDISTNHIFANNIISNDISANDISCVDISAVNFFGTLVGNHTITTATQPNITSVGALTSLVVSGDLSGNDASFNDISAVNFFSVGSSFFGDVHATGASSFNDISANDISCVDISAVNLFLRSNSMYVQQSGTPYEIIFPSGGGNLVTSNGTGSFPGWTAMPAATSSTIGGIVAGYTTAHPNYKVQMNNNNAYVAVPWTNTQNTYTAGTGIDIDSFSISTNLTTQDIPPDLSGNCATADLVNSFSNLTKQYIPPDLSGNCATADLVNSFSNLTKQDIPPDLSGNCATADLVNSFSNLTKQDIPPDLSGNCATADLVNSFSNLTTQDIPPDLSGNCATADLVNSFSNLTKQDIPPDLSGNCATADLVNSFSNLTTQDIPPDLSGNCATADLVNSFSNLTTQDIPPDLSGNCATADLVNSFSNLTTQDIPPDLSGNCATADLVNSFSNLTKQDIPPDLSGNCATSDLVNSFSNLTKQDIPPDLSGNCETTNKIQSGPANGIAITTGDDGTLSTTKASSGTQFVKCSNAGVVSFVTAVANNTVFSGTVADPNSVHAATGIGDLYVLTGTPFGLWFSTAAGTDNWVKAGP